GRYGSVVNPRSCLSIQRAMFATRIATGGGSALNVTRSPPSDPDVAQPTRRRALEKRGQGIVEAVDQLGVRQVFDDVERVLANLATVRLVAELCDRFAEVREVLAYRDVVHVRLEIAAIASFEQNLCCQRPGRLDVPAAEDASADGGTVVAEEPLPDVVERRVRVLGHVRAHRVPSRIRQLEEIAARLCSELALAPVEERCPAWLVEPVSGRQGDVEPQLVRVGGDPLRQLTALAMAKSHLVLEGAIAEVDRALLGRNTGAVEVGIPAGVRDPDDDRPGQPFAIEVQRLLRRELRHEQVDAEVVAK